MSSAFLKTYNLDIGYNSTPVLSDIDVALHRGNLVCFMGPNGSGKSTLLRTICGFQSALRGEVQVEGKPISALSRQARAQLFSVVLTDKMQSEYMTGRELVTLGRLPYTNWLGRISSADKQAIDDALEVTGANEFSSRWIYELSDGQRQKLFIARALAQQTPFIILDEPTAHLDLNNRVAIINLLRTLAHDHDRTILMATHELDLALQRADELWLADPHNTVIRGMPEDLVLNGEIDRVFQFKGYDLKSGQVTPPKADLFVNLEGSGAIYLWTKNALERNGIGIDPNSDISVLTPAKSEDSLHWKTRDTTVGSLEELIRLLRSSLI
jgi:iron complex transport system ATP-binding protein